MLSKPPLCRKKSCHSGAKWIGVGGGEYTGGSGNGSGEDNDGGEDGGGGGGEYKGGGGDEGGGVGSGGDGEGGGGAVVGMNKPAEVEKKSEVLENAESKLVLLTTLSCLLEMMFKLFVCRKKFKLSHSRWLRRIQLPSQH